MTSRNLVKQRLVVEPRNGSKLPRKVVADIVATMVAKTKDVIKNRCQENSDESSAGEQETHELPMIIITGKIRGRMSGTTRPRRPQQQLAEMLSY